MRKKLRILIIGSSGTLGHIVTYYLRECGYYVFDISKHRKIDERTYICDVLESGVLETLSLMKYDVIINFAALLVKPSEINKPAAILLNSWLPHRLEQLTVNSNTKVIHMSTDGIFNGKNGPYIEKTVGNSSTFYGKTKYLGEIFNNKDITIRTSVLGPSLFEDGTGLFHWFVSQTGNVNGYENTKFNAITTLEFAKIVEQILNSIQSVSGILHIASSETISKAEFLRKVRMEFSLLDIIVLNKWNEETDHSLLNTRNDFYYVSKNYEQMLKELKDWMICHKNLYPHYLFLKEENKDENN